MMILFGMQAIKPTVRKRQQPSPETARLFRSMAGFLFILCLVPLLLFFSSCRKVKKVKNKLDSYVTAAHELWGFDGVALVAVHGKIIFCKGYGLANKDIGEPNTAQTRFYIGSITKQFTAAAIMKLQEDGLLNINDPISKYLPEYPRPNGDKIKIKQLLSHTSGIPNYTDDPIMALKRTMRIPPEELMESFQYRALDFEPGTKFKYSNSNYIILGAIIERVSGQSYEAYLHHNILKPAGMNNTGYARREAGIPDRADGYTIEGEGTTVDAVPVDHSILHSAGALYSTVGDIQLWDEALYHGTVLSKKSVEEMMSPHKDNYGYGWLLEKRFGKEHVYHGGFLDGFNSIYSRWPGDHVCIVIFSNEDEAPVKKMADGLAAIIFDKPYSIPIKKEPATINPALLKDYTGMYEIDSGLYRFVLAESDTLYTRLRYEPREILLPQAADTFFFSPDNTRLMIFKRNQKGKVIKLGIVDEGMIYIADKIEIADESGQILPPEIITLPKEKLEKLSGLYWIESYVDLNKNKFTIEITAAENKLIAAIGQSEPIELLPLSEYEFIHPVSEFQLKFISDDLNNITGCIIRMGSADVRGAKIR